MRKYLLIGFLIFTFSFVCLAQSQSKFKIEDFVWARILPSKTAIFVGDRFELRLEIFYFKDIGIQILTEDLEKDSMAAVLPDSVVLEKAEVSEPVPWNKYWFKTEAVYTLFYPEKKHTIGILFFPQDSRPLKVRFKWVDEEDRGLRTEVEIYEVDVLPGQFVLGVRSMLTDTSNSPRDHKLFSGNFFLKHWVGLFGGLIIIMLGLYIPIKGAIVFIKNKLAKEKRVSIRRLLKNEFRNLQALRGISDSKEFGDSFCLLLRNVIGIKTDMRASSMTATEIQTAVTKEGEQLVEIAGILKKYDDFRYNPEIKPESRDEALKAVDDMLLSWMGSDGWYKKLKTILGRLIRMLKVRIMKWIN